MPYSFGKELKLKQMHGEVATSCTVNPIYYSCHVINKINLCKSFNNLTLTKAVFFVTFCSPTVLCNLIKYHHSAHLPLYLSDKS